MKKSILIIGNGSSLKNSNLGKKIDEFDEVVRINEAKTKGWETDAGLRFTIWSTFNPDKRVMKFIKGYEKLGYNIEQIKDLVKEVREIWYVGARSDCSRPWRSKFVMDIGLQDTIKRHASPLTLKRIKRTIEYPTTGFVLIWLFSLLYDKIYLAGFDFGGLTDETLKYHHYFHDTPKYNETTHNFKSEYEVILSLIKDGKVEYLKPDSEIKKGEYIYDELIKRYCDKCKKISLLYKWEGRICNYCEAYL